MTSCRNCIEVDRNIHLVTSKANADGDRIVVNVGGMKHETFRSTLKNFGNTRLNWIANNEREHLDSNNELFFDRNPTAFAHILNFYRTGKLHVPNDICGPLFEEELNFWGLDEKLMEPCCWPRYTEHREAQENLKNFEHFDINPNEEEDVEKDIKLSDASLTSKSIYERLQLGILSSANVKKLKAFRSKIWQVFNAEGASQMSLQTKVVSAISVIFIFTSIVSMCLHSTWDNLHSTASSNETQDKVLFYIDTVTFCWFTIEFLIRLLACPRPVKFIFSAGTIIDAAALIPYYLSLYYKKDSLITDNFIIPTVKLLRLFRFFRLSVGLDIFKQTLFASSKELLLLFSILSIPVAVFATAAYYLERKQNHKFNNIPKAMWWAVITMTTVGYGDMTPETPLGKVLGSICAAFSVLIIALPVSIIGNNFQLFYSYAQARRKLPKRKYRALVGAANSLVTANRRKHEGANPRNPTKSVSTKAKFKNPMRNRKSTLDTDLLVEPKLQIRRTSLIDIEAARLNDLGLLNSWQSIESQNFPDAETKVPYVTIDSITEPDTFWGNSSHTVQTEGHNLSVARKSLSVSSFELYNRKKTENASYLKQRSISTLCLENNAQKRRCSFFAAKSKATDTSISSSGRYRQKDIKNASYLKQRSIEI